MYMTRDRFRTGAVLPFGLALMDVCFFGVSELICLKYRQEFFTAHLFGVATDGTEHSQEFGPLAVFGRSDLLEVSKRPVHLIAVNVVNFHAWSPRTNKGLINQMMAEPVSKLAHYRVRRMHVRAVPLHRGTKIGFKIATVGTVEPALVGTVKNFAADKFRRNLFDNRYVHKTARRRDGLSPKGDAKVGII